MEALLRAAMGTYDLKLDNDKVLLMCLKKQNVFPWLCTFWFPESLISNITLESDKMTQEY